MLSIIWSEFISDATLWLFGTTIGLTEVGARIWGIRLAMAAAVVDDVVVAAAETAAAAAAASDRCGSVAELAAGGGHNRWL